MASVVPAPHHWNAFAVLARCDLSSWSEIERMIDEDRTFRSDHETELDREFWYGVDGRPAMRQEFGRRRLLKLLGGLERMGRSVQALLDQVDFGREVADEGDRIVDDLRPWSHEHADGVWIAILRIRGPLDTIQEGIWNAEKALTRFREGSHGEAPSGTDRHNQTGSRIEPGSDESTTDTAEADTNGYDPIAEAGIEALQEADDAWLRLAAFQTIAPPDPATAAAMQVPQLERLFHEKVRLPWTELDVARVDESAQLRADIDNLLATRLLAPSILTTQRLGAWDALPWFSIRARHAITRLAMDDADRGQFRDFLRSEDASPNDAQAVSALLDQIMSAWLQSPERLQLMLAEGFGWEAAGGVVNLIPSPGRGPCCPMLVTVSLGRELDQRLRQSHDHVIRCTTTTRRVILVSDYWDDPLFVERRRDTFETLRDVTGCRFAVLLKVGEGFRFQAIT